MELTRNDSEFISVYNAAKRSHDKYLLICIYAFLLVLSGNQDAKKKSLLNGFTKGEYKRAIKYMRASKSDALREDRSELAADFDNVARYIRENCLSCCAKGGEKIA